MIMISLIFSSCLKLSGVDTNTKKQSTPSNVFSLNLLKPSKVDLSNLLESDIEFDQLVISSGGDQTISLSKDELQEAPDKSVHIIPSRDGNYAVSLILKGEIVQQRIIR